MTRKTIRNCDAITNLIARGLWSLGEGMINTVDCARIMHKNPAQYSAHESSIIRRSLEAIGANDREWALSWLRDGVKNYRRMRHHA